MQEQSIMALIVVVPMTLMVVWFSKTVAQGSISFSFKALGLHFEVKKGS
jgi:lipopolysaccharide/colanic/teichoic acid biosynthesis glycosyltransferase